VQKRVRGYEALAWTADLARATQVGLVAFVVGGSFVSIAFSPFLYLLAGIAVGTRGLVERELAALAPGLALNRAPAAGRPLVQPAA
jgi:putative inorganic carbon (hco3(-)) transporter